MQKQYWTKICQSRRTKVNLFSFRKSYRHTHLTKKGLEEELRIWTSKRPCSLSIFSSNCRLLSRLRTRFISLTKENAIHRFVTILSDLIINKKYFELNAKQRTTFWVMGKNKSREKAKRRGDIGREQYECLLKSRSKPNTTRWSLALSCTQTAHHSFISEKNNQQEIVCIKEYSFLTSLRW